MKKLIIQDALLQIKQLFIYLINFLYWQSKDLCLQKSLLMFVSLQMDVLSLVGIEVLLYHKESNKQTICFDDQYF